MFACPRAHSLMVSGPKESTCVEEGYWKPDPKQVQCKGGCLKRIYAFPTISVFDEKGNVLFFQLIFRCFG